MDPRFCEIHRYWLLNPQYRFGLVALVLGQAPPHQWKDREGRDARKNPNYRLRVMTKSIEDMYDQTDTVGSLYGMSIPS